MSVLLLNPPAHQEGKPSIPPLGLGYIAAVLRENNINVDIIDLDLEKDKFKRISDIIKTLKPRIVGIGALTLQVENVYAIADIIKGISDSILVVIGGPHASSLPEQTLLEARGNIDIAVVGEGEYTFLDIVNGKELKDIPGIVYRKDGTICKNGRRPPISDLDSLPLPARDMLPIEKYRGWGPLRNLPTTHLIASRGCPFECIFCSEKAVFGKTHRIRKPEKIVEEVQHLIDRYGVKEVAFYDDLFTLNKKQVLSICREIERRKIRIDWKTLSRVDTVDFEMLKAMKAAGCWMISYGFESGSQEILDAIRKRQTVEQCLHAAHLTQKAGIRIYGFFMIGNIGETKETICQTIQLARKLKPDYCQFTIVRPDPGSYLYNTYKQEIERANIPWREYYAFPRKVSKMPVVGTKLTVEELFGYKELAYMHLGIKVMIKGILKGVLTGDIRLVRKIVAILINRKKCIL